MSLQDALEESSLSIRRKLFDNQIELTGKKTKVVRIRTNENKYGDEEVEVISKDSIEAVISYPPEIPLTRFRNSKGLSNEVADSHVYLFDIIPIEIFTKWEDKVEKYDYIIDRIKDEEGNYITLLLSISEMVGSFRSSLLWRKGVCAPYNGPISKELQNAIDMLELEK